jgi:hypothetical protein
MEHFLFHLLFFGCFEPVLGGYQHVQLTSWVRVWGIFPCVFSPFFHTRPHAGTGLLSYQSGLVLVLGPRQFFWAAKWRVYRTGVETGIKLVQGWYYLKYLQDWYCIAAGMNFFSSCKTRRVFATTSFYTSGDTIRKPMYQTNIGLNPCWTGINFWIYQLGTGIGCVCFSLITSMLLVLHLCKNFHASMIQVLGSNVDFWL